MAYSCANSPRRPDSRCCLQALPAPSSRPLPPRPRLHGPGHRPPGHRPPGHRPRGHRPPGHRPPGHRPPGHRLICHRVLDRRLLHYRVLDRHLDHCAPQQLRLLAATALPATTQPPVSRLMRSPRPSSWPLPNTSPQLASRRTSDRPGLAKLLSPNHSHQTRQKPCRYPERPSEGLSPQRPRRIWERRQWRVMAEQWLPSRVWGRLGCCFTDVLFALFRCVLEDFLVIHVVRDILLRHHVQ